jgi:hypothetical protein
MTKLGMQPFRQREEREGRGESARRKKHLKKKLSFDNF